MRIWQDLMIMCAITVYVSMYVPGTWNRVHTKIDIEHLLPHLGETQLCGAVNKNSNTYAN